MIWILYLLAIATLFLSLDSFILALVNSKKLDIKQGASIIEGVSLIICAKNEAQNIKCNLEFFLKQQGVNFELILVNDHSSDASLAILEKLAANHPQLKIVEFTAKTSMKGKKAALDHGIRKASFENIVVSDMDCRPASDYWLAKMTKPLEHERLILGYSPFVKQGGMTNKLSQWENYSSAISSFAFARFKKPYMGLGRNMAYKKEVFLSVDGFSSHKEIASGDDDLFVSSLGGIDSAIVLEKNAWIYTWSAKNFKSWYNQKRRHLSTSYHYKLIHQLYLGFKGIMSLVFYGSIIVLIASYPIEVFLLFLIRYSLTLIINFKSSRQLGVFDILLFFPIWEILLTFAQSIIHIHNFINPRKDKWLS